MHSAVDFNLRIPSNAALAALAAAACRGRRRHAASAAARGRCVARARRGRRALALATVALPREGWTAARQEVVAAATAPVAAVRRLRLERARAALVAVLRRRPAHAESWLMLAGVEQALGRHAAAARLARHAAGSTPSARGCARRRAAIEAAP